MRDDLKGELGRLWGFKAINALERTDRMREYTDEELAQLAQWAEAKERGSVGEQKKKGYGAIRQGIDWVLRDRILERQQDISTAEKPKLVEGRKQ